MPLIVSILDSILAVVRNFHGVLWDDGRNNRGYETVDKRSEMNSVHFQPQNKRRKVQVSLRINSGCVDKIRGWLKDDEITAIGIYGMGGIGKTTLAKELHTRLTSSSADRHAIAWVSVELDFTVYQLQQKIAGAFGLDLEGDKDENRRATMLYAFLSRCDKCTLFLDDLWGEFRREDVGIPKKCKLIVTSRLVDVCRMLHCQKVIKVESLSEEETWQLLHHSIGGYSVLDSKQLSYVRKLVYKECAGLPLAVTGLANSMERVVHASQWSQVLETMDPFTMGPAQMENVLSQLKLSYDRLYNIKLQHCFLYTALYPKGYAINKEELIRLWIGERLIDDVLSLQAQYDLGHSIINKLLNSCLLEACQHKGSIKMHGLVRRMALSVSRDRFMVKAGVPSGLEFCGNFHAVSLINSSISLIPLSTSLNCTNLSTLLLQHNPFEVIPESFFSNMRGLRVLSLSDTCIIRLPSSFSALQELQVLDLSCCQKLQQVPLLSKLHKLEFLDLSRTAIEQFPSSLEMLKRLKELNLSSIPEPNYLPKGILPVLSRLKRLSCHVKGIIQELQNLTSLEILDATFGNLFDLSSYVRSLHWSTLECFHLQVGRQLSIRPKRSYNRAVSLHGCTLSGRGQEQIVLPYDIQELYLENCSGFHSLSDIVNPNHACGYIKQAEIFSSLEICTISRCHDVEKLLFPGWMPNLECLVYLEVEECAQLSELIVDDVEDCCYYEGKRAVVKFPQLKQLVLTSLPELKNIYKGQLVCSSLESLTVMDCPNLKRLPFSCTDDFKEVVPALEWIEGQQTWWDLLKLDDIKSKALLKPSFRCRSSMDV
ncbi:disease resistance protein RPS2-like [Chenopodium quinoa]|nr:disease resistance protein RPS2-like [Chenopodium quinoa]